eukprot:191946-Prymnesium_polylepis.1
MSGAGEQIGEHLDEGRVHDVDTPVESPGGGKGVVRMLVRGHIMAACWLGVRDPGFAGWLAHWA